MSKLVSALYNIARKADTVEMVAKGKGATRLKNKVVGRKLIRKLFR